MHFNQIMSWITRTGKGNDCHIRAPFSIKYDIFKQEKHLYYIIMTLGWLFLYTKQVNEVNLGAFLSDVFVQYVVFNLLTIFEWYWTISRKSFEKSFLFSWILSKMTVGMDTISLEEGHEIYLTSITWTECTNFTELFFLGFYYKSSTFRKYEYCWLLRNKYYRLKIASEFKIRVQWHCHVLKLSIILFNFYHWN